MGGWVGGSEREIDLSAQTNLDRLGLPSAARRNPPPHPTTHPIPLRLIRVVSIDSDEPLAVGPGARRAMGRHR